MDRGQHRRRMDRGDVADRSRGIRRHADAAGAAGWAAGAVTDYPSGSAAVPDRAAVRGAGQPSPGVPLRGPAVRRPTGEWSRRSAAVVVCLWFVALGHEGRSAMTAAAAYRQFWAGVGKHFPDLGGAVSTEYYAA